MPIVVHRTPHDSPHVALNRCSSAYIFTVFVRLFTIVVPFILVYAMNSASNARRNFVYATSCWLEA